MREKVCLEWAPSQTLCSLPSTIEGGREGEREGKKEGGRKGGKGKEERRRKKRWRCRKGEVGKEEWIGGLCSVSSAPGI